jgi:uncharacterized UPF0160 family protein
MMRIITHNGQFHADEVFACALILEHVGELKIERTRVINVVEYSNTETFIVDVGGIYDPEMRNFDHHQDETLEASNMLVLFYLRDAGIISENLFLRYLDMFREISMIDRNGYEGTNGFQVNSLIKSFNSLENGFNLAIQTARGYVRARINDELSVKESRDAFDAGERIAFETVVCTKFPKFWKAYKECIFLVAPTQNDTWAVHSINSREYPLIAMGNELFFHAGRMIAVYATMQEAEQSARHQCINTFG